MDFKEVNSAEHTEEHQMEHKGTNTLETKRLRLRRFRAEDAKGMYRNWASDPEVTKYVT